MVDWSSQRLPGGPSTRCVLEISRTEQEVDEGQNASHASRFGPEVRVAHVRVYPNDAVGLVVEPVDFPGKQFCVTEVPSIAEDDDGRPWMNEPPEASPELPQTVSNPSPAPRWAEREGHSDQGPLVRQPGENLRELPDLRAERKHPSAPYESVHRVDEGSERCVMIAHRPADVPEDDKLGAGVTLSRVLKVDPLPGRAPGPSERAVEIDSPTMRGLGAPTREARDGPPKSSGTRPQG